MQPIPCSKELLPIGFQDLSNGKKAPRVISQNLLDAYVEAGASKVFFIIRKGKWDIPTYYGDGEDFGTQLAYLIMNRPYGIPYTLDQAYPYVGNSLTLLGFPDMLIEPQDAFQQLIQKQEDSQADVVLGVFPTENEEQRKKVDMVDVAEDGSIRDIQIKPPQTDYFYSWIMACWTPRFAMYMHEYLKEDELRHKTNPEQAETYPGHIFLSAIKQGMHISSVRFDTGSFVDLGTPERYEQIFKK